MVETKGTLTDLGVVDVSSGKSITLGVQIPLVCKNNIRGVGFFPFPFFTKNANYTLYFSGIGVTNSGYDIIAGAIESTTKRQNGIDISYKFNVSGAYSNLWMYGAAKIDF